MAAVMLLSCTPVMAASVGSDASDKSVGEDTAQNSRTTYDEVGIGSSKTNVYLTVDSSDVLVGVPVEVILSGTPNEKGEYIGDYSVVVKGDFPGDETISVVPEDHVTLKQEGKDGINASISQDKLAFSCSDVANGNNTSDGRITATGLTAGSWDGEFTFIISMIKNIIPAGYTVLYKYDLSATETDDVAAYYCVPNENTEQVQIPTGNKIAMSIKSLFSPIVAYASDDSIIEINGVRYYLSDDDTLVIAGEGEMKENIIPQLINYDGLYRDVKEHFNATTDFYYTEGRGVDDRYIEKGIFIKEKVAKEHNCVLRWRDNELYPYIYAYSDKIDVISVNEVGTGDKLIPPSGVESFNDKSLYEQIVEYIDSVLPDYASLTPTKIVVNDGVTNISNSAFSGYSKLKEISISNTVQTIESNAFKGCAGLTDITIPKSITKIGDSAFANCIGLTHIDLPDSITKIGNSVFSGCSTLADIKLPIHIISIPFYAFENCKSLTGINIPDCVETIGMGAFRGCSNLTSIDIPDNVTILYNSAFWNCSKLNSIRFGSNLKEIKMGTFSGCSSLTDVYYSGTVDEWNSIKDIVFNSDINLYLNNELLTAINLTDKTSVISKNFRKIKNITKITIPNTVNEIPIEAFREKTELVSITIPDSVTSIGMNAFRECNNLTEVFLPGSITNIGSSAFCDISKNAVIYCETQEIADLLTSLVCNTSQTTIIVDASRFA